MQQDGTDITHNADPSGNATFLLNIAGVYYVSQEVEVDGTLVESSMLYSMSYEIQNTD
jgi:hypothetical protein